ncbi:hydrolase, HAD superfamily [Bacillus thuringiensis str. Al Hakam]|nr:hydrolase, HAD superfamily [Bacillus thuringiensis str. Al Hakam]
MLGLQDLVIHCIHLILLPLWKFRSLQFLHLYYVRDIKRRKHVNIYFLKKYRYISRGMGCMNREEALHIVKQQMHEKRYIHTIGVMETAIELAKLYGVDEKKAEVAAIFHDYAKCRAISEMEEIIKSEDLPKDLLCYNKELWHAPVGAYLVEKEVGITDPEILQAITYHTSGHEKMTMLDKVIYVADYIEPGRKFPGVEEARKLAYADINQALLFALKRTIQFLMEKNQTIYPLTFQTYNAVIKEEISK